MSESEDKSWFKKYRLKILLAGLLVFLCWFVPWVPPLAISADITVNRLMPGNRVVETEVGPDTKGWTPLAILPRYVAGAVVAAEDNNFYHHWGLDFASLFDSMQYNWRKGRYARGASTITQQVVKVSLLSQEKSLVRKAREAAGAFALESITTKKKILEWYLNLVEFGPGIYGIKQAAGHYFGVQPGQLSVVQAVHLAAVLPSPKKWSSWIAKRQLTEFGQERFAAVLTNMKLGGFINADQWRAAMANGDFGSPITRWPEVFNDAIEMILKPLPTPEPGE